MSHESLRNGQRLVLQRSALPLPPADPASEEAALSTTIGARVLERTGANSRSWKLQLDGIAEPLTMSSRMINAAISRSFSDSSSNILAEPALLAEETALAHAAEEDESDDSLDDDSDASDEENDRGENDPAELTAHGL